MSFTDDVKHELTRLKKVDNECQLAELSALIRMNGSIQIINKGLAVKMKIYHGDLARKIYSSIKEKFKFSIEILVRRKNYFYQQNIYELVLPPQQGVKEFLLKLGFLDEENNIIFRIKDEFIQKKSCQKAYLRGAFLGGGSVNNPQSEYHLEYRCEHSGQAEDLLLLLKEFNLEGHLTEHKGKYVIYFKSFDEVAAILNLIGAHQAQLKLEDASILKEVKNNVNRKVNCETANLDKTVDAAVQQIEDILVIEKFKGLTALSKSLREIAVLRKKHPYASLKELGQLLNPPLSKSGVNHRIRRIKKLASEIRGEN